MRRVLIFARQPEIIAVRIKAEQRQPEAVLSPGCAVAAAGVAAGPHEDGHHVESEADRPIGGRFMTMTESARLDRCK